MSANVDPRDRRVEEWMDDLRSPDSDIRLTAAAMLGRLRKRSAPAVGMLAVCLRDQSEHVRKMAALALGDIGRSAAPAVSALIDALADPIESVRRRAAIALAEIAGKAPEVIPQLRVKLATWQGPERQHLADLLDLDMPDRRAA